MPVLQPYQGAAPRADNTAPGLSYAEVTPGSTNLANGPCRALYIGSTGNVSVVSPYGGSTATFTAVSAGVILPIQAIKVTTDATTATGIVAIY